MADTSPTLHSPPSGAQRPKGILKNSNSYQLNSPSGDGISPGETNNSESLSPTDTSHPFHEPEPLNLDPQSSRPTPHREMSDKEITIQNTLANAGPRRNSSTARKSSTSRRHSRASNAGEADENSPRLKWDEANLYLTEQERGDVMKIDEPKTPYVHQLEPPEDDEELDMINPNEIMVDELDSKNGPRKRSKGEDIPDLDLGEAEDGSVPMSRSDSSDKRVVVDDSLDQGDAGMTHGETEGLSMSEEARRKHREFEEKRKKHYEIPPGALGHPDDVDERDENGTIPPMP